MNTLLTNDEINGLVQGAFVIAKIKFGDALAEHPKDYVLSHDANKIFLSPFIDNNKTAIPEFKRDDAAKTVVCTLAQEPDITT